MLNCTKCTTGRVKVLRGVGHIRALFEVRCLNPGCRKQYIMHLGVGRAVLDTTRDFDTRRGKRKFDQAQKLIASEIEW